MRVSLILACYTDDGKTELQMNAVDYSKAESDPILAVTRCDELHARLGPGFEMLLRAWIDETPARNRLKSLDVGNGQSSGKVRRG